MNNNHNHDAALNSHIGVMWEQVDSLLDYQPNQVWVETNFGSGSYSQKILAKLPSSSQLIAFDCDAHVINAAQKVQQDYHNFSFIKDNFVNLKQQLLKLKINKIDCLIADLGLSTPQIYNYQRGFSYIASGPLDMRYDTSSKLTAADILNKYSLHDLTTIFYQYGEEPLSKIIAHKILLFRQNNLWKTTEQLQALIKDVVKVRKQQLATLKRIFQALRIAVNNELNNLQAMLVSASGLLSVNGRILVVSFHSLEDRIVKNYFYQLTHPDLAYYVNLKQTTPLVKYALLTKKLLRPSAQQIHSNPACKSAKLRAIKKVSN